MQAHPKLSARQRHVLWATVRHYVATAEPVGSKALVKEYNLSVSPATVRNAMGSLEKSGLLYQPHTSAGRIPSDSGYRIYVDELMRPSERLAQQVDGLLETQLQGKAWNLDALFRDIAHILSSLSGYITLITLPQTDVACIKHLQLLCVDPGQILLVVVLDSYGTQSVLVPLLPEDSAEGEDPVDQETLERELQILSNFLNTHLRGRSLAEVALLQWDELDREFQRFVDALQVAMQQLAQRSYSAMSTQFLFSGLAEVLRQPEFSETQQLHTLVHLLEEEPEQLGTLIHHQADALSLERRVRVWIGAENPLEPMKTCALVLSNYQKGAIPVGSVGMLGPTRMIYEDAVALVQATADYLSEMLEQN